MEIAAIFTHPLYERHSNDIAVIKLKERIEFSENTKPSCVWHDKRGDPYKTTEILGRGPYNLNDLFFTVYDDGYNYSTTATLSIRSSLYDLESCSKIYEPDEFWSNRVSNQHICYGFDRLYVPGVCESRLGEPSVRTYWEYGRHLWHTFGLSSYSRECGSGTPIIQSRMASHIDWIDSVIFGLGQNSGDGFQFNHSLKYKGDECQLPTGEQGLCKMDSECSEITRKFNSSEILCSFEGQNPIICCPNTWSPRPEVEEFFNRNLDKYEAFRPLPDSDKEDDSVFYRKPPKQDEAFAHMALVGVWLGPSNSEQDKVQIFCYASLITEQYLVTSKGCISYNGVLANIALLGNFNWTFPPEAQVIRIVEIIQKTNESTPYDDLVLMRLEEAVNISKEVLPAQLWLDTGKVPLLPYSVAWNHIGVFDWKCNYESCNVRNLPLIQMSTISNEECQRRYESDERLFDGIRDSQMCALTNFYKVRDSCDTMWGFPLQRVFTRNGRRVPYLIGIVSQLHQEDCENNPPIVFTRLSHYANWIYDTIMSRK